jgi:hypothetical protein
MRKQLQDIDMYWTQNNLVLGHGQVERETTLIRLRLHRSTEKYFDGDSLIKLSTPKGERVYIHAKPYILIPDITLTVATYSRPAPDGAIGNVVGSDVKKLRPLELGNAQAWYYPADKALVLWECSLFGPYRHGKDPREDATLTTIRIGFERVLLDQFPETARIYTTWEPMYARLVYQRFLQSLGYRQSNTVVFVKEATRR